jgi:YebC/PmpR family DNA-binding regulatory protein
MGRAFEFRKARKMKRWGQMAKTFTRIGKDIVIAVKAGGPDAETNARLRAIIQNAKAANMPKENVERAIKKASSKDEANYDEIVYEGYGPHGIAFMVETATDNTYRTVANVRMYFNRSGGSLGTSGSVAFMFEHKCFFRIAAANIDLEELEFELIDFGAEEVFAEDDQIVIYGDFTSFGGIQKFLEDKHLEVLSSGFDRIPANTLELSPEQEEEINKLIEKFEEDDDVQAVYHNMKETAGED